MTHGELVIAARKWLAKSWRNGAKYGHSPCGVIITELTAATFGGEIPDAIGFIPGKTILVECKTSLSDFRADKAKTFRQMPEMGLGSQRWYLAPTGIIPMSELPSNWGLIEIDCEGSITVIRESGYHDHNADSEVILLISALRRLNVSQDGNISIKKYDLLKGVEPSKFRATIGIEAE
jgi:hypothetical protein